ncbi:MAG: Caffeine dehydrogenase subunit gamma [Alphaproteobacteria bacterium MarineAlpha9_Bin7]|nr:MAG: Caffeine dehydrogenase subunit gamma [Alphaproteobacteria bacterium MarineAlpha9_Bin7]
MPRLNAGQRHTIQFELNGKSVSGETEPRLLLSDFLRGVLGSTGSHVGCEHGVCGACTVRVNGCAVRSCLTLAIQINGEKVETVEGLAGNDTLSPLQRAFRRHHALQCGFCTPGILMSLSELLDTGTDVNEKNIREFLSGHLCRCTGYGNIVRAALEVFAENRSGRAVSDD